jgi:hypothetical protein
MARNRRRTRAQRRYRRAGYTWEIATLQPVSQHGPRLIVIHKASSSWREYRPYLLDFIHEVIRPICKQYIYKGGKP